MPSSPFKIARSLTYNMLQVQINVNQLNLKQPFQSLYAKAKDSNGTE